MFLIFSILSPCWRKLKRFSNLVKSFLEKAEGVGWYESILSLVPLKSEASQILTCRRIIKSRIWAATSKGREPLDQFCLLFASKIPNLHGQACFTSRIKSYWRELAIIASANIFVWASGRKDIWTNLIYFRKSMTTSSKCFWSKVGRGFFQSSRWWCLL